MTGKKFYSGYPFDENNCNRAFEYKYKKLEGYDVVEETEYIPLYNDPYAPAKGRVLSEQVRELHSKQERFYNKHRNIVKSYYTRYELDDEYPEKQNSVVSYSNTITNQHSYENEVLISADNERYMYKYDENGKKYAIVDNYKKRTTYSYPNGQPKGFDCSWGGTYENPLGCTHFFNEEGYFLESYNDRAEYTHKDKYGNWTRMLIGHKRPGTVLIGEREITYYSNEK